MRDMNTFPELNKPKQVLKSCKCGATPKIRTRKVDIDYFCFGRTKTRFWVECPSCFRTDGNLYDNKSEAVEAWNRRADDKPAYSYMLNQQKGRAE